MPLNAALIPSGGGGKRAPALEPGAYPARLVQIIDLGTQKQRAYQGEEKPPRPMIRVTYELLDEFLLDDDGKEMEDKPRWISEDIVMYSLDSDLATSTKRYFALDPEKEYGGDWEKLIGAPCIVAVTNYKLKSGPNAGQDREKVHGVTAMRAKEAAKAPELVNEPKIFDLGTPDLTIFLSLPNWLQDKIKEGLDFPGSILEAALKDAPEPEKEEAPADEPQQPEPQSEPETEDDNEDW